jgi:hypothetical protein
VKIRAAAWLTVGLLPLLSGCVGAVAIPLVAGGTLSAVTHKRVKAATAVPASDSLAGLKTERAREAVGESLGSIASATLVPLDALPAPVDANDPWQVFVGYALGKASPAEGGATNGRSALLKPNPSLLVSQRRDCRAPSPAVIIDLDEGATPFDPRRLTSAPAGLADGLARLRQAGIVVLWISQLPATQARDVAQALRSAGLDPQGRDQLLLIRGPDDRKQLLRENANDDVCIIAIAGDRQSDFDELFDYLRNPDSAVGLNTMLGEGWFLVPSLDAPPGAEPDRSTGR